VPAVRRIAGPDGVAPASRTNLQRFSEPQTQHGRIVGGGEEEWTSCDRSAATSVKQVRATAAAAAAAAVTHGTRTGRLMSGNGLGRTTCPQVTAPEPAISTVHTTMLFATRLGTH